MKTITSLLDWVEERLPVRATFERHLSKHPVPKYVNFWYVFGALAMITLIIQIGSGVWLMMFFTASAEDAFASVEYIMRDVEFGWLLRYLHSTGASAFFLVVYLHIFRGLIYGSYQKPRELVWLLGCAIYVLMMAEGFLGYVLPWGNMSYWAAQVIVSLFGAIPLIGEDLVTWIRGDYLISGITLNRFYALHVVVVPLLLVAAVLVHIMALHEVGAGNQQGIEIEDELDEQGVPKDGIPFFPYKVLNALVAFGIFLFLFLAVVFFEPTFFGYFIEKDNYFPANPLSTPEHIVPVWYYTPFYAMLRAVTYPLLGLDAKFWGLIVMAAAISIIFFVPWLDGSPVKSYRYRGPLSQWALAAFVVCFILLGYLGAVPPTEGRKLLAQLATIGYFAFFVLMPVWSRLDTYTQPPKRLLKA